MNKNEALKIFGENLKRIRLSKGFSQDELARMVGYTNRSSINKIEIGRSGIPAKKVNELARVLGVSPLELFQESVIEPVDISVNDDGISAILEKLSEEDRKKIKDYAEFLLSKEDEK